MGELNNERQFFGEVRCKFTARKMRSGLASIYANVTAPTRQRYISVSLNVKVKPEQFLKGKQRCLISNELTGLDNFNNRIANGAIKAFKEKIDKINGTLQEADDPYAVDVSALILPKKHGRELSLCDIFYHIADQQLKRGVITDSAHRRKISVVKSFVKYYEGTFKDINTSVYNGFADWLVSQGLGIGSINAYLGTVKSIVNDTNKTEEYGFVNTANWSPIHDKRSKEEKRSYNIMFTDDDLARIEALEVLGKLEVVRDFFVFICNVGQRPSDCKRILKGDYSLIEHNGAKFIEITPNKTKKTGNTATVPITETVAMLLSKFSTPEYQKHLRQTNFEKYATNKLKDLFKAAGVSTDAEVTVQIGTEKVTKTVSSDEKAHLYLARHYFVSKMIRQGLRPDEVIKMSGHSNTKMVNDIYTHLNSQDRCSILENAFKRITKEA